MWWCTWFIQLFLSFQTATTVTKKKRWISQRELYGFLREYWMVDVAVAYRFKPNIYHPTASVCKVLIALCARMPWRMAQVERALLLLSPLCCRYFFFFSFSDKAFFFFFFLKGISTSWNPWWFFDVKAASPCHTDAQSCAGELTATVSLRTQVTLVPKFRLLQLLYKWVGWSARELSLQVAAVPYAPAARSFLHFASYYYPVLWNRDVQPTRHLTVKQFV